MDLLFLALDVSKFHSSPVLLQRLRLPGGLRGTFHMNTNDSVIASSLLGFLAGCGSGGGNGDAATPPPDNTPTLQSIEVTPSLPKAAAGTTAQFTATGLFTDNSTQDLTTQVTWGSSDAAERAAR